MARAPFGRGATGVPPVRIGAPHHGHALQAPVRDYLAIVVQIEDVAHAGDSRGVEPSTTRRQATEPTLVITNRTGIAGDYGFHVFEQDSYAAPETAKRAPPATDACGGACFSRRQVLRESMNLSKSLDVRAAELATADIGV